MGMNDTPSGERLHIGFFGRRNVGKSSLVNRVTGQDLAVVSRVKGTTTDPVRKAMELLPLGPVVIIDTPGHGRRGRFGRTAGTESPAGTEPGGCGAVGGGCGGGPGDGGEGSAGPVSGERDSLPDRIQ